MKSDKEVKKEFKKVASENPDRFYPTAFLKKEGFYRGKCPECGKYFWSVDPKRAVCGDPSCSGGFNVVSNNPSKVRLTYVEVWKEIVKLLEPRGYKPIDRYPVVARWNPTTDFVMASIAAFQPYVITGEQEPPAKKLIIPQFSLRFGDIDNVGITGSHLTGFVMIGQHMFVSAEEWNQEECFKDIYDFLIISIGLPKEEITVHEDAWAGGGSFGPCMEFFSRGVELFNQVYTMFEQTPNGDRDLKLKVLDMGLGMERIAWFSQGTPNIYEATFPLVLERLRKLTNVQMDHELYKRFSSYSAYLNADESEDMDASWKFVAGKLGMDSEELKAKILPMTALYSIAEHSRCLLVAINDGGLPSNVGGGYNLRVILRRALSFIDQFGWNIDMGTVAEWHAEELRDIFPELSKNIEDVKKVLAVEKEKFENTKQKAGQLVSKLIEKDITEQQLIELYDSNGILPELIAKEAAKLGKKVKVPDDFYAKVSALHEKQEQIHATERAEQLSLEGVPDTKALYYSDYSITEFSAKILKIINNNVILDQTYFYPTSGGQLHDIGIIEGIQVVDVFKQGAVIVHVLSDASGLKEGQEVKAKIDPKRRLQLAQHHTSTHIVNAAARTVLGNHINQAGAKKTEEKAHLDVTHYQSISDEELKQIEEESNKIIQRAIPVKSFFLPRAEAEKRYGMAIYQGGAVPGKMIRIIDIEGLDVEACGGTHLKNTKEAVAIKLVKSSKIQDGIVRIEFVAGDAEKRFESGSQNVLKEVSALLCVPENQVPARVEELFKKWKAGKKAVEKGKQVSPDELELSACAVCSDPDILGLAAKTLCTQPEHVPKTVKRFLEELDECRKKVSK